jgi:hypothetical protein
MPTTGGPYLVNAFFCNKVLIEQDGVPSYIRAVDRWTISGPTPNMPISVISTSLAVTFKSGIYRGAMDLVITPISPSGRRMPEIISTLIFESDDERGSGVTGEIGFPVPEPGLYWFEVKLGDTIVTMMPLRVVYLKVG